MKYNFKQYKLIIKCNTRIRDDGGEKISRVLDLKQNKKIAIINYTFK